MGFHLIVTQDFGAYRRGDRIEDAADIDSVLAGEQHVHVLKLASVDPEPETEAAPESPTLPPVVEFSKDDLE